MSVCKDPLSWAIPFASVILRSAIWVAEARTAVPNSRSFIFQWGKREIYLLFSALSHFFLSFSASGLSRRAPIRNQTIFKVKRRESKYKLGKNSLHHLVEFGTVSVEADKGECAWCIPRPPYKNAYK
jgi:hypothetical protein